MPKKTKIETMPITLRIRREVYDALPIPPAYYSGRRGTGKHGAMRQVLEDALIAKYGLKLAQPGEQAP